MHSRLRNVIHKLAFYILVSATLAGCIFDPDEDNNFQIVDPTPKMSDVTIKLDLESDTVAIFGPTTFSFEIETADRAFIYDIQSSTGSLQYLIGDPISGLVRYEPAIDSGFSKLFLRVTTSTKTGSLGDRLGAERLVYEKTWVVKVNSKPPRPSVITSIAPENGSLKISWTKNTQSNFDSYQVSRMVGQKYKVLSIILDPKVTSFVDEESVGNEAVYTITTTNKSSASAFVEKTYIEARPVAPVHAIRTGNKIKLVWSSTMLYNNFAKYEVYSGADSLRTGELIHTTTSPKDTTFFVTAQLGLKNYYSIRTYSRAPEEQLPPKGSTSLGYMVGESIPAYDEIFFSSPNDIYITYKYTTLTSYRESTNEKLLEVKVPPSFASMMMSNNGSRLYGLTDTQLYWFDIATLEIHKQDLSSIRGSEYYFGMGETSDGRIMLSKIARTQYGTLQFYDLESGTLLEEYTQMIPCKKFELSSDGKYVISNAGPPRILKLNTDHTVEWIYNESGKIYFDPSDQGNIIVGSDALGINGSVRTREMSSGNLVSVLPTPPIIVYDIDVIAGRIIGALSDGSATVVYDYVNTRELDRIQTASMKVSLHGNYLYSPDGARLTLKP